MMWAFAPRLGAKASTMSRTLIMHDYDYDVIIVGCGVGGHGAALHARSNGLKTAIFTGKDVEEPASTVGVCLARPYLPHLDV